MSAVSSTNPDPSNGVISSQQFLIYPLNVSDSSKSSFKNLGKCRKKKQEKDGALYAAKERRGIVKSRNQKR